MLIEETPIPDAAFPVAEFRTHLRMGTGFGDDTLQDPILTSFLRAAIAAIEARTGKALYQRSFLMSVSRWHSESAHEFPIGPVTAINQVQLVARDGSTTTLDAAHFRVDASAQPQKLRPTTTGLPPIPTDGHADIRFTAGWGAAWETLPPDLGQAVLLLAAHYYEFRHEVSLSDGCMPFGVSSLIERYRTLRLGFGGQS